MTRAWAAALALGLLWGALSPEVARATSVVRPHPMEAADMAVQFLMAQRAEAKLEAQLQRVGQAHVSPPTTEKPTSWWTVRGKVVKVEGPVGFSHVAYLADGQGRLVAAHLLLPLGPLVPEAQDFLRVGERFLLRIRDTEPKASRPASSLRWATEAEARNLEAVWQAWQESVGRP